MDSTSGATSSVTVLVLVVGALGILMAEARPAGPGDNLTIRMAIEAAMTRMKNDSVQVRDISIDHAIDNNIEAIRCIVASKLDPIELPDRQFTDSLYVHHGILRKLSNFKRTGHCSIYYADKVLALRLNIGWDDLTMDYEYIYKIWWWSIQGSLLGWTRDTRIYLEIGVVPTTSQVELTQVQLLSISKYGAKVVGHWYDFLLNWLISLYKSLFGASIYRTIERLVSEELAGLAFEVDWLGQDVERSCGMDLGRHAAGLDSDKTGKI